MDYESAKNILDLNHYCYMQIFSYLDKLEDKLNFKMAHSDFSALFDYDIPHCQVIQFDTFKTFAEFQFLMEFCGGGPSVLKCKLYFKDVQYAKYYHRILILLKKYCKNVKHIDFLISKKKWKVDWILSRIISHFPMTKSLTLGTNIYKSTDVEQSYKINIEDIISILAKKYGSHMLQILEISNCTFVEQSLRPMTSIRALICDIWLNPKFQPQFQHLEFLALRNLKRSDDFLNMLNNCKKLKHLKIMKPYFMSISPERVSEFGLIRELLKILNERGDTAEEPFLLAYQNYHAADDVILSLYNQVHAHPHGKLIHLDFGGHLFDFKIDQLRYHT